MNIKSLRRKYITGERVQWKYLLLILLSMFLPLFVVGGCLYFLIFNIMAEQLGIPEYIATNLIPVINKINIILLLGFPIIFGLIFLWGTILSHRFAGPLARLRRDIESIAKSGDYKRRLRIRRHDDLRPLAEALNGLLDKLSGDTRK